MLLVLEPDSRKFRISQGSLMQMFVTEDAAVPQFDVEFLDSALVIYLQNGVDVSVYQDGRMVQAVPATRRLWSRLYQGIRKSG